jgi:heterodisulfide reductase subunit C
MGPEMDFLPSQVMRLVHLGAEEEVLGSQAIWLCASCETCTARCPMDIDIAAVMDALRILAIERKAAMSDTRGKQFNRSFLGSVRRHGRVFELGMMAFYKLRTLDFFSDVDKVPKMLAKGKLALLPKSSKAAAEVREVFGRADQERQP